MPASTAMGWEDQLTWDDVGDGTGQASSITIAPGEPVTLVRDEETKQVIRVIYGNMERMAMGEPVVIWTEELIRDENGQLTAIQTVRPNGTITLEHMVRDADGMFTGTTLEYL
jgi:hypothetical protein